jgi:hypothetical protein
MYRQMSGLTAGNALVAVAGLSLAGLAAAPARVSDPAPLTHTYVLAATADNGPVTANDGTRLAIANGYAGELKGILKGRAGYLVKVVLPGAEEGECRRAHTDTCDIVLISETTTSSPTRPNLTFSVITPRLYPPVVEDHHNREGHLCPAAADPATAWEECPFNGYVLFHTWITSHEGPAHHWSK